MWLVRLAIRNPYLVISFVIMLSILGVLTITRIPVDILPAFNSPAVQVMTYYPGMPAKTIEKTISNRIERWVNQAPGARLVESRSVPGVSIVKVFFREDIDTNEALTLTNSLALGALPNLPPNTLPPVALPFDATGTLPVSILTVQNPYLDDAKQKDIARINVRNMLGAVPGTISPVVVGGKDRSVMIYLDPLKMQARNLAPTDIVTAVRNNNLMMTPGTAYLGSDQLLLDSNSMIDQIDDLNSLPITVGPNSSILLRDIASAEDASSIQTSVVRIDGKNEVFVPLYRQKGASSLAVVDGVKDAIPTMQDRLPSGTILNLIMDQTAAVRASLRSVIEEGVAGVILVSIMILFFLGDWKMMFVASLSIPLALMGGIIGLFVTGNTINTMTLSGLALAIGPLVDEAIVELENNHRNHLLGKSRIQSAIDGSQEVLIPIMVSALTTFIVLAPLAFLPGIGGFLFRPLTLAVGFAMLTSFVLSRTFVPMMCVWFLPRDFSSIKILKLLNPLDNFIDKKIKAFDWWLERVLDRYSFMLGWALNNRSKIVCPVIAAFFLSLLLIPFIGKEFFPLVDTGQINIRVRAPSNLRLDATASRIKEVEVFLKSIIPVNEREPLVSEIGLNADWSAAYTTNSGQQDAIIRLQLKINRTKTAQKYASEIRLALSQKREFSDLRFDFDTGGMITAALNMGSISPIDIEIQGGKFEESLEIANKIRASVSKINGTADVRIKQRDDAPYMVLEVDRIKSAEAGLSVRDVMSQVVVAMNSSISIDKNFWVDSSSGNQYFVSVQYPEDADRSMDDIMSMPVKGAGATNLNLGSLVKQHKTNGSVEINHSGLARVTNVLVNLDGQDLNTVAKQIEKEITKIKFPEGMKANVKGEFKQMHESFAGLGYGLGLAVILVYLLQVMLFRSWVGPGVIMLTVPLGFIGIIWMLFLTNTTLNIQSLMGAIFLIGIAVNNGVLLVEFANAKRHLGLSAHEAITNATRVRFKPILMTFLATVLALLPMAIGIGEGNEASIPLARAVVGGMLSSTLLTLFIVPIAYTALMKNYVAPIDIDNEEARSH